MQTPHPLHWVAACWAVGRGHLPSPHHAQGRPQDLAGGEGRGPQPIWVWERLADLQGALADLGQAGGAGGWLPSVALVSFQAPCSTWPQRSSTRAPEAMGSRLISGPWAAPSSRWPRATPRSMSWAAHRPPCSRRGRGSLVPLGEGGVGADCLGSSLNVGAGGGGLWLPPLQNGG